MTALRDGSYVLVLGVGLALIAAGVLLRLGYLRFGFILHENAGLPTATRNGPYVFIPGGIALVAGVCGAALREEGTHVAGGLAFTLAALAAVVALWWSVKPPDWVRPKWLRTYERHAEARYREPSGGVILPPRAYVAVWFLWALLAVYTAVFVRSLAAVAGLGFGLAVLLAVKPGRRTNLEPSEFERAVFQRAERRAGGAVGPDDGRNGGNAAAPTRLFGEGSDTEDR